jgi:N-acylneuraminate cytidylyltransferase/CMP-N,N'-diacetyllegionaminic acid synthase
MNTNFAERNKNQGILAIIPARGDSKDLPRKNIRLLCGKPLVAYSIEAALSSEYIDRVVISTEDREIAHIAEQYGGEVIERPTELARDDTPSLLVYQHVIEYLEEKEKFATDLIIALQPTSPLRIVADIDGAIQKFLEAGCDSVLSVCQAEHPPYWMYTLDGDRMKVLIQGGEKISHRQDAPSVYRINGAVYVTRKQVIMIENRVWGDDTRAYIMPWERSVDIDTEIDLKLAELLMQEREYYDKNNDCR